MKVAKTISEITNLNMSDGIYVANDLGLEIVVIHINLEGTAVQIAVLSNDIYYRIKEKSGFSGFINSNIALNKTIGNYLTLDVSSLPTSISDILISNNIVNVTVTSDFELLIQKTTTKSVMMSPQSSPQSTLTNNDSEYFKFVSNFPANPINKTMYLKDTNDSFETIKEDNFVLAEFRAKNGELIKILKGYQGEVMSVPVLSEEIIDLGDKLRFNTTRWSESNEIFLPIYSNFQNVNKVYYQTNDKYIKYPKTFNMTRNATSQLVMASSHLIDAHAAIIIYPFYIENYQVFVNLSFQNTITVEGETWSRYQISLNILGVPTGLPGTITKLNGTMNVHEDDVQPKLIGSIPIEISIINPSGGVTD
ncbi:hypothetical protein LJC17_02655 [Acholeplasma sp. OttesenSCG-928-E16]|nr:hypothetical protein [Acholeplasma sp. OttesenSCG-928-E16]